MWWTAETSGHQPTTKHQEQLLGRKEQLQPGGTRERINISACVNKSGQFLPPCCSAVIPMQPSRSMFATRSCSPSSHVTASNTESLKRIQQSQCLLRWALSQPAPLPNAPCASFGRGLLCSITINRRVSSAVAQVPSTGS